MQLLEKLLEFKKVELVQAVNDSKLAQVFLFVRLVARATHDEDGQSGQTGLATLFRAIRQVASKKTNRRPDKLMACQSLATHTRLTIDSWAHVLRDLKQLGDIGCSRT